MATGELLRDKSADPLNSSLWVIVWSLEAFRYCLFCVTDSTLIYPSLMLEKQCSYLQWHQPRWQHQCSLKHFPWLCVAQMESPSQGRKSGRPAQLLARAWASSNFSLFCPPEAAIAHGSRRQSPHQHRALGEDPMRSASAVFHLDNNEQKWRYAQDFAYPSSTSNPYTKHLVSARSASKPVIFA